MCEPITAAEIRPPIAIAIILLPKLFPVGGNVTTRGFKINPALGTIQRTGDQAYRTHETSECE
jgi:hypothetical protein